MKQKTVLYIIIIILVLVIVAYILQKRSGTYQLPVQGRISSRFGYRSAPTAGASTFHKGIDIATPINTEVKPTVPGKVLLKEYDTHGGYQIIVEHAGGWQTGYAHLNGYGKFKVGDKFKAGDVIAYTGNTGTSTAPHLHTSLTTPTGVKVDPEKYIDKKLV
jgi:murein DD-endopeptidase MepM/ murein hydrolase activator NlpD